MSKAVFLTRTLLGLTTLGCSIFACVSASELEFVPDEIFKNIGAGGTSGAGGGEFGGSSGIGGDSGSAGFGGTGGGIPKSCNKNNVAEEGEDCDGTDIKGATCASLLGDSKAKGTVTCSPNCTFVVTQCAVCGNGKVDNLAGEKCDGATIPKDLTCAQAFSGNQKATGVVTCNADCSANFAGCSLCGNGKIEGNEECEVNANGEFIFTKSTSCKAEFPTYKNPKGAIRCSDQCKIDKSRCVDFPICGDGIINQAEEECEVTSNGIVFYANNRTRDEVCQTFLNDKFAFADTTAKLECDKNCKITNQENVCKVKCSSSGKSGTCNPNGICQGVGAAAQIILSACSAQPTDSKEGTCSPPSTVPLSNLPNSNPCVSYQCAPNGSVRVVVDPNCCPHSLCEVVNVIPGQSSPQHPILNGSMLNYSNTVPLTMTGCSHASDCLAIVCTEDKNCCTILWDNICVNKVKQCLSGNPSKPDFSCNLAHPICVTGSPLPSNSDPCVQAICKITPACCTTSWDANCVTQVGNICKIKCNK